MEFLDALRAAIAEDKCLRVKGGNILVKPTDDVNCYWVKIVGEREDQQCDLLAENSLPGDWEVVDSPDEWDLTNKI